MLGLMKRSEAVTSPRAGRVLEVGWINRADKASFMWDDPRPFRRPDNQEPKNAKALQNCPAVVEYEARHFMVTCPIDLNIALAKDKEGKLVIRNLDGPQSAVGAAPLSKMVHLNGPGQWRHPNRPLIQISTSYYFVADEVCWMNQLPPYLTWRDPPWPGLMVGGRLPIHIWPRAMMWAFEWCDPSKPLQLKRGEPWFLLRFETDDPTRPVRLVEAEWTPELDQFNKGAEAVTNYQRRTWSLFKVAERRRPEKLVKKVERAKPAFSRETSGDF
jgi:hypothetical protein